MESSAYLIIYGSLAAIVALIVGGIYLHDHWWGWAMIVVGAAAAVVWLIMMLDLMASLNSDI